MPTTPINGLPSPDDNSPNLPPIHFDALNAVLDTRLIGRFTNAADRNTKITAPVKGIVAHTANDDRYWRHDGITWRYLGGSPPPIVASTVNTNDGWTPVSGHIPATYVDGSGLVHVVGGVVNNGAYTPGSVDAFLDYPITLAVGFRPVANQVVSVIVDAVPSAITGTVLPDGRIRLDNNGAVQIPANRAHYFDGIKLHPNYTGAALA